MSPGEPAVAERGPAPVSLPDISAMIEGLIQVDRLDDQQLSGRVTFGPWFHGVNGAVHGGAVAMLLEQVLGRLAITGRTFSRTAFLHVDYRSLTPIERELDVDAWFEQEDGRKRFVRATIRDGDRVCVEAESLGVELRPGQL